MFYSCWLWKQRVEVYYSREGKKRKLDPYSASAKELYRFYIQELGFDDTWISVLAGTGEY